MKIPEDKIVYRYFGIELRIVFYFTALFFLLLSIISFESFFLLSLFSFLLFLLIILLTYLDSNHHHLILDQNGLSLSKLFTKNNSKENRLFCVKNLKMQKSIGSLKICSADRQIFKIFTEVLLKRIPKILLCFALIFSLYPVETFASETNLDSLIFRGIDLIHQDSFDQGISEFKKIIEFYLDEPAGYFFLAASLQTLIDDYRNERYKADFEKYINLAIEKGSKKVEENPNSALDHFYLGGSLGYRGIYRSFRGSWWSAFRDGGKAHSHLKKAVELNPELYDAYFGLGAYHYWKSVKSKLFWWLPFLGDERQKGIQETMLAIQKGKYAKDEATYSLLRIYLEEKDYPVVLKWSQEVKRINEDDPFRLWMTGFANIGLGNWGEAQGNFLELLNVLKSSPYYDPAGEYECRYWLAYIYFNSGNLEFAKEELNKASLLESEVEGNDYAEPFADKIEDLQKDISKKLKSK